MAVCIGGMHRSGTSMVAKLLMECGLYLGPDQDLMPSQPDNPGGFWENLKFVEINEEVLNEFGGGWDCPPSMPQSWDGEEGVLRQREKARALLGGFEGREPWGWKDPRSSLTLLFWRALVPDLKVVVCVRNPLEVALSLHRRNGFSYAFGLTLWQEYHRRILQSTSAQERLVTHYDAYFRDARAEMERVLGYVGMEVPEEVLEGSLSEASSRLRHNWFGVEDLLEVEVSSAVMETYARMCEEAAWVESISDVDSWPDRAYQGKGGDKRNISESVMVNGKIGRLNRPALEAELLRREREALRAEVAVRDAEIQDLRERLGEGAVEAQRPVERVDIHPSHDSAPTIMDPPDHLSIHCNICGQTAIVSIEDLDREKPSCTDCGSTVRFRSIVHVLSMELFGESLALPDFPTRPDITGIGMSDWDGYAVPLANKLGYTNTYYHKEPRLDITSGDPVLEGTLDFVISSEVFEHVPPPVSIAFENVRKLLKPTGVLIFTVPYGKGDKTVEHFPELHDYRIVERDGSYVLENTTRDGVVQTFDDLVFHGGPGATLEMRLFSESSLIEEFKAAGLSNVKIYKAPDLDHGIYWREDWSLPMAVRRS